MMSTDLEKQPKRSIVLFSGGLDSTTILAMRHAAGDEVHALSFSYGQRHTGELQLARSLAESYQVAAHKIISIDLGSLGGSSLTSEEMAVPQSVDFDSTNTSIPNTYVPARNIIFLTYALAYADVAQIADIYIGVNAVDYSGYPDCRPEFIEAFQKMARLGTRQGVESEGVRIHAPLVHMKKSEIVRLGHRLGVDYALTHTCYAPDDNHLACGRCDACHLRRMGFEEAGIVDPTRYQPGYHQAQPVDGT